MESDVRSTHEMRLLRLAVGYLPISGAGAWLSLRYGVGAHPGGDPARDLPFRGTGMAAPLVLPATLLGAGVLIPRRGAVGTAATVVAGLVGLGFTAGTTVNLPNDIAATRAAGSPTWLTVGIAMIHWVYGPAIAVSAFLALRQRRRRTEFSVG